MMLSNIPDIRLGTRYSPGHMVVDVTGKILIMRNDRTWASLQNRGDDTWFLEREGTGPYIWRQIVPKKINEIYTIGTKL